MCEALVYFDYRKSSASLSRRLFFLIQFAELRESSFLKIRGVVKEAIACLIGRSCGCVDPQDGFHAPHEERLHVIGHARHEPELWERWVYSALPRFIRSGKRTVCILKWIPKEHLSPLDSFRSLHDPSPGFMTPLTRIPVGLRSGSSKLPVLLNRLNAATLRVLSETQTQLCIG